MDFFLKQVLPALAGLVLAFPYLRHLANKEDPAAFGFTWKPSRRALLECLLTTALVLLPLTFVSMHWPFEDLPRRSGLARTLRLATAGLSAAFIEEIFFRGWLQRLLRKKTGAFCAIALTSALFASAHIFVAHSLFLLAVFFPGFVMGCLRERHGNISTSTLFHALANIWAIWFAPLRWPSVDWVLGKISAFF